MNKINDKQIKRVIITGATGSIGTALINNLIKQGIEVLCFCRNDSPRNKNIPSDNLVTIKYCDISELCDVKNDTGKEYDVFYHFAWQGTTGESRNDMYLQNQNVKYALDAVEVAKRFGCKRFIGAGSQAEYGRLNNSLNSNSPTFPENGYGMAKLCAGEMTREYAHKLGVEHIWTRILSVYGPSDSSNTMIISLINKLLNNETPKMTKCEQIWDYLYCEDAAQAFYLLEKCGIDGKTYVIGSGTGRKLSSYVEDIKEIVNPSAFIDYGAIPYSDKQVMHLVADITELEKDTGWHPAVSFKEGIAKMLNVNHSTHL